ncbi:RidA family protein [Saccharibacter sp. 17.LH.SD]|uniref:Rid family hydrolase n=1 Tax=Saccharibacter sp. 17.LH.SD TaxID=2689393 RepID=UPI00136907B2|nr:Rid family hydrolase [Saccharibacter sp. 17.LH.SD]MXV43521.1 RidA family protein [Saccharibacter sp. 17.LH.SD]
MTRKNISSGSSWEEKIGYSRAVVTNGFMFISPTAATGSDGKIVGKGDVFAQTQFILAKIGEVLSESGSRYEDVIKVTLYLTDISRWHEAAQAHADIFLTIRPVLGMLHVMPFVDQDILVEIDVTACLSSHDALGR